MKLALSTWPEVAGYLETSPGIILPIGSTEQHGPMGLVGTDALCAVLVADAAAARAGAMVAPELAYTPAPFNTAFPGTLSVSDGVFESLVAEIFAGLIAQGFSRIYVLNAHGANLAPLRRVAASVPAGGMVHIRSWWEPAPVNDLRRALYGRWEGMHATPSEVAMTQARFRVVAPGDAADPPRLLEPDEIAARADDRHGSAARHRREFPDGRVGSHSALATPGDGERLIDVAGDAIARDYAEFLARPN